LNKEYTTLEIAKYFSKNRIKWEHFYLSEQKIINQLNIGNNTTILDVGCGCGGLGLALKERFGNAKYSGVEINVKAAIIAAEMNNDAIIYTGDILDLSKKILSNKQFDIVFSLSCIDWNVEFEKSLNAIWQHVRPGGYLMATFRLTNKKTINDINKSYQFINYDNKKEGEIASYVVININDLFQYLVELNPSLISAYGYWGQPSLTAITPFDEICFTALYIQKRESENDNKSLIKQFDLPIEILNELNN
jgi:ubiquinone/menaquinone biosynthesis C-methylase UbiE